jgi:hypothetical protein
MNATDARARFVRLQAERRAALEVGVPDPSPYMTRLSEAIASARVDYTMSAVIEIAERRTDHGSPSLG